MNADAVLAECVANPDDDAPRLVWADLVGGERGELVVLQCDLARGGMSPRETKQRHRRERELLAQHAVAWAGTLPRVASRWSFRRGFIESAKLIRHDREVLRTHPLLSSIEVAVSFDLGALELQLRGLALRGFGERRDLPLRLFGGLRALALDHVNAPDVGIAIERFGATALEQLWFEYSLRGPQLADLLDTVPRLVSLDLGMLPASELPELDQALRALRLGRTGPAGLEQLSALAPKLERLCFEPRELVELPDLPALRTLELDRPDDASVFALASAAGFAKLEVLRLRGSPTARTVRALIERFGPQLSRFEVPAGVAVDDWAFAGEVGTASRHAPLLHASPAAMLSTDTPSFEPTAPIRLCRLDTQQAWEIAAGPPDEPPIQIGRGGGCQVRIDDSTVSRLHATLEWNDGYHTLNDLSDYGTLIAGERIARVRLDDGAVFSVGRIAMQYRR